MIAAMRIAVPLAESQLNVKTAASAVGLRTTGGMRCTILSRPGIAIFGAEIASSQALTSGRPQTNTITERRIQGSHGETFTASRVVGAVGPLKSLTGAARSCSATREGLQTRRKPARQTIEHIAAMMSTSHGP